jgi:hypothetical protein
MFLFDAPMALGGSFYFIQYFPHQLNYFYPGGAVVSFKPWSMSLFNTG